MNHTRGVALTVLVHDRPGVLVRIANVFYRRGISIVSLDVRPTELAEHSRLRAWVRAPLDEIQRVARALENLVDVVRVEVAAATGPSPPAALPR